MAIIIVAVTTTGCHKWQCAIAIPYTIDIAVCHCNTVDIMASAGMPKEYNDSSGQTGKKCTQLKESSQKPSKLMTDL
ncbi:hypothetical protein EB796_014327 [Bugula neritina]|uniref:Uncharacterized protein n=1 Tax=Bugula neritina TaxID=10212 RepID=A0A7J7JNY7_BUGNE|nr:hypothetical protein EB796_014327 [Bugula neritina]